MARDARRYLTGWLESDSRKRLGEEEEELSREGERVVVVVMVVTAEVVGVEAGRGHEAETQPCLTYNLGGMSRLAARHRVSWDTCALAQVALTRKVAALAPSI